MSVMKKLAILLVCTLFATAAGRLPPRYFFINAPQGGYVSLVGVPTLAFHEGVPGHHFQKAIQGELQDVPTFRRAAHFTAYAEGWALYVEKLAWEYGYYDDNPYGNYGRLQSELFRAVRLVVDTGIHARRWTREEAIDYMASTLGWNPDFVTFAAQSTAIRPPLYLLTVEVVLLALYYVTMVAALAVEQVEREFVTLRSRGASGRQIGRLQLGEVILIAGVALLSGPFLGSLLVQTLTSVGPLADVSRHVDFLVGN